MATFGAAEHYFPRGIRFQEYAHRNDQVALGTSLAADIREGIKGCVSWLKREVGSFLFGTKAEPATPTSEQLERAPRVFLDGEHDFGPYISKLPHFFIEKYQSEGTCTGDGVAQALIQSIHQGRLSDVVHARITEIGIATPVHNDSESLVSEVRLFAFCELLIATDHLWYAEPSPTEGMVMPLHPENSFLAQVIPNTHGARVLDIGFGSGVLGLIGTFRSMVPRR